MSGNPIIGKDLYQSDGSLEGLLKLFQAIDNEIQQIPKHAADIETAFKKIQGVRKADQKAIEDTAVQTEKLIRYEKALVEAKTDVAKKIEVVKNQTAKQTAENRAAAKAVNAVKDSYNDLSAQLSVNLIKWHNLTKAERENTQAGRDLTKEIRRQRDELKTLDAQTGTHVRNVGNYKSALGGVITAARQLVATYLSLSAAQRAVDIIFGQTRSLDGQRVAFEQVLGSVEKAGKAQLFLKDVSQRLGVDLITTSKAYLKFVAATKTAGIAQDDTNKIFESFAKAGSTLGLTTAELDRLFKGLEQIISKGSVSSEELRGQIGDVLPGAFSAMAESLGVTTAELQKLLKEGKVLSTSDNLLKFAAQIEKAYGIENTNRVDNLAAAQGRFNRAVTLVIEKLDASGTFKAFFDSLTNVFNVIGDNLSTILTLGKAVVYLTGAWLAWKGAMVAGNLVAKFALVNSIRDVTVKKLQEAATLRLAVAQKALALAIKSNPVGLALAAVVALAGAYSLLKGKVDSAKEAQISASKAQAEASSQSELEKFKIQSLIEIYGQFTTTAEGRKAILEQIDKIMPGYLKNLDVEKTTTEDLTIAMDAYLLSLEKATKVKLRLSDLEELIKKKAELERRLTTGDVAKGRAGAYGQISDFLFGTLKTGSAIANEIGEINKQIGLTKEELKGLGFTEDLAGGGTGADDKLLSDLEKQEKLNSLLKDGRNKELKELEAYFQKEKEIFEKNGLDTNLLIASVARKRAEINEKYNKLAKEETDKAFNDRIKQQKDLNNLSADGYDKDIKELELYLIEKRREYANNSQALILLDEYEKKELAEIKKKYVDADEKLDAEAFEKKKSLQQKLTDLLTQTFITGPASSIKKGKEDRDKQIAALQAEFDAAQDFEKRKFELAQHSTLEAKEFEIDQEIAFYQFKLDLAKNAGLQLTAIEKARYEELIKFLQLQKGNLVTQGEDIDLFDLLGIGGKDGLDDKSKKNIEDAFAFAKQQLNDWFEYQREINDKLIEDANRRVDAAKEALQTELDARNSGYANNVATAQKELHLAKKQQQEALKQQQKYQRAQQSIDTAIQASSMATAIANMFKGITATLNPAAFAIAIAASGVMIASFVAAKLKLASASKRTFRKGNFEEVGGGSHESGKDTFLYNSPKGPAYAEKGETVGVFNAKATKKYKPALREFVQAANNLKLDAHLSRQKKMSYGIPLVNNHNVVNVNTSRMEQGINKIVRNTSGPSTYRNAKGQLVEDYGSTKITYIGR
jgi:tape measure domain-containing protein